MRNRAELHELLEKILGSSNVYYQPPATVKMSYPAIVYSKSRIDNSHADNSVYRQEISYEIIVIDKMPDSNASEQLSMLPKCRFDRHYASDGLNHDVFTLYL